jgi:mannose-6-phosphate isomerase-like protein (cupin superfamily)
MPSSGSPASLRASWKLLATKSVRAPAAGALTLELQQLRSLAALERTVRQRELGSLSLREIVATLGLSQRGFDGLFVSTERYADGSFDEALARTSTRVASVYRAKARGSRRERMRSSIQAMLDAHDEQRRASRALCVVLPPPGPEVRLALWELPAGEADGPYRHTLKDEELLVVLEGRPTVHTTERSRDLQENEVVALMPHRARELLNYTHKPLRFLALTSAGDHSSSPASCSDPSPIS